MSYATLQGPTGPLALARGRTQLPINAIGVQDNFVQVGNNFRILDLGTYQLSVGLSAQAIAGTSAITVELWNLTLNTLVGQQSFTVTASGSISVMELEANLDLVVVNAAHQYGLFVSLEGAYAFLMNETWEAVIRQQLPSGAALLSTLYTADKNLVPNACVANFSNTGQVLGAEPANDGYVIVLVNGQAISVGDGDRAHDCYFSADGGATAKTFATLAAGDALFFNAIIAGFPLGPADRIDLNYCI